MKKLHVVLIFLFFAMVSSCAATERGTSINKQTTSIPDIGANQSEPQRQNATAAPEESREASGKQKLRSWEIDYEVSGGFAGIQRKMNLSSDGKLIATDLKHKRTVEQQISEEQLTRITNMLTTINCQQVSDVRSKLSDRCADCFLHSLTLTIDDQQHTTSHNDISLRHSPYTSFIGLLSSLLDAALVNKNIER